MSGKTASLILHSGTNEPMREKKFPRDTKIEYIHKLISISTVGYGYELFIENFTGFTKLLYELRKFMEGHAFIRIGEHFYSCY